ncbi:hypothetical protein AVEN_105943-1 [Araneus ventricosus]|uniref:Uncharacterized protein n=1 Tax=Araneus ventricosus TaxID=182803 RepID=A0A4Y2DYM1_ARAVE|nr:hypothetical protein AVEN_105943-1 [Araneus ventricosus]
MKLKPFLLLLQICYPEFFCIVDDPSYNELAIFFNLSTLLFKMASKRPSDDQDPKDFKRRKFSDESCDEKENVALEKEENVVNKNNKHLNMKIKEREESLGKNQQPNIDDELLEKDSATEVDDESSEDENSEEYSNKHFCDLIGNFKDYSDEQGSSDESNCGGRSSHVQVSTGVLQEVSDADSFHSEDYP